jgi:hypothetical protein
MEQNEQRKKMKKVEKQRNRGKNNLKSKLIRKKI